MYCFQEAIRTLSAMKTALLNSRRLDAVGKDLVWLRKDARHETYRTKQLGDESPRSRLKI